MDQPHLSAGDLLREWRQRRRLSQLQLAVQAEISSRHLSFIETGRAQKPPMNALRLSLHPQGAAPRIANFREWRAHLLAVTRRRIEITGDQVLAELLREVTSYPVPAGKAPPQTLVEEHAFAVPFKIVIPAGLLSFFSTTTVFGTPVDVTLSELALELFFPADAATAEIVHRLAGATTDTPSRPIVAAE